MKIVFPDGSVKEFNKGISGLEVAKSIGERLAMAAIVVEVNGVLQDLSTPIEKDAKIRIITFKDKEGVEVFRHSSAHILGAAVTELFKYAKPTIGPAVEQGFYYDFAHDPFKPEDLEKINKKMEEIVKQNIPFERIELTKAEAKKMFSDNKYKLELIEQAEGKVTAYKLGKFVDLCKGPHVVSSGFVKAIKTTKMGSAYWKGDAKNDTLQRIYGISFQDKKELEAYFKLIEEAEKRNHVKIGKKLDLFSINEAGPGFPFFHHKGLIIRKELINFWREEHQKANYLEIQTPTILSRDLWETSGHWKLYQDSMYTTKIDDRDFAIKPMNCPGGLLVYKTNTHSYKELPLRIAELGHVHRHELSGALNGLFRVRAFTQDDAHIFCEESQVEDEIARIIGLTRKMLDVFKFPSLEFTLSVRSERKKDKYLGTDKGWSLAETSIKNTLNKLKIPFTIAEGEAKFYGPSLDIQIRDALGRQWQCGTIQVDFNLPELFDITYEGSDGKKHRPFMLHRVVYGSLERFMGVLIEHFAGKFPLWLSPVQVKVLPIADRHADYANKAAEELKKHNIRVEIDTRVESTPKKVRDAQLEQVNYILVVGDKEAENKTVNVRTRDNVVHGEKKVDSLIKELLEEVKTKSIK